MRCNNCGNEIIGPNDTYCPRCGSKLWREPHIENHSSPAHVDGTQQQGIRQDYQSPSYHSQGYRDNGTKKGNNSWLIIAVAVVLALAIVGGALYMGISHQDEESLWAQCEQTHEISDYKKYIDTYPNGEHSDEAKKMYTLLINEKTMWEQVQASNDEFQLRSFINNHPKSKFLDEAKGILDDVVWNNAIEKNTKMAFDAYMREFPSGKHIAEARSRYEEFRMAELTIDERDQVKNLVQQFLTGLEQWSVVEMMSTCNTSMTNFMGKHNANHSDVRDYFSAFEESDIDSIAFSSLAVDVRKSLDADKLPRYNVDFTVTRRFWRSSDVTSATTSLMRGTAIVDHYFRFDEFSMDKVADHSD